MFKPAWAACTRLARMQLSPPKRSPCEDDGSALKASLYIIHRIGKDTSVNNYNIFYCNLLPPLPAPDASSPCTHARPGLHERGIKEQMNPPKAPPTAGQRAGALHVTPARFSAGPGEQLRAQTVSGPPKPRLHLQARTFDVTTFPTAVPRVRQPVMAHSA